MHSKIDKHKEETKKRIRELGQANSKKHIEKEDEANIIEVDRVRNDIDQIN